MKQQLIKNAIAVWVAAGSIVLSAVPSFSMENEKGEESSSARSIQTEAFPDRFPGVMSRPEGSRRRRIYFDKPLQLEAKARRETIPTERKEEAIRLHQSMLLDRFQGADAQGQVFLSFSVFDLLPVKMPAESRIPMIPIFVPPFGGLLIPLGLSQDEVEDLKM